MGNTQNILKNKAKAIALGALVISFLVLVICFALFLNQEAVFKLFGSPSNDFRFNLKLFLKVTYPYIIYAFAYGMNYCWINSAQKSFKAIAILFIFSYIGIFSVARPILSWYSQMRIGTTVGVDALAAYSVMTSAVSISTNFLASVAMAMFFISNALMIAQEYVLKNKE